MPSDEADHIVGEIFSVTANLTQQFEFNNPNSSVTANLTQQFEFDNPRNLLNIVGFSILFLMGTIGNTVIGILSYRQTRRPENKGRTNVHKMVLSLTVSDLIVSYIVIPLEIGWRISVQWYAGNFACKFLMFMKAFAFYLSSMTLVTLSLDRCLAIAKPMASLKRTEKVGIKLRGQIMITAAWIISALCALPQTLVFRVLKHPQAEFYQCIQMGYFEEIFDNTTIISPSQAETIYSSFFLLFVYMVPLVFIVVTYATILYKIFMRSKKDNIPILVDDEIQRPAPSRWQTAIARASNFQSFKGKSQNNDKRATLRKSGNAISSPIKSSVALRMSVIHVSTFIVCWTPFLVIQLWHIVDKKSAQGVSPIVQDVLFLLAYLNSCLNPVVYGGFYFKNFRKRRPQNGFIVQQVATRFMLQRQEGAPS